MWELPGSLHGYSYHPDELPLIAAASSIWPSEGTLNPRFHNYGTLQIYLLAAPVASSRTEGGTNLGFATLLGRLITIMMGTATVAVCLYGGKKIAGDAGAVTSALFAAIAPLHVQQSQFVTVDIPAAFWTAMALVAAISAQVGSGGLFAGLAAATKYTAGMSVAAPLAAAWLRGGGRRWQVTAAVMAAAVAGFLIGCPGVVLWRSDFLRGFGFELQHAQSGHGLVFAETGPGWLYHLLHSLLPGLGWPMLALSVAAIVYALLRRSRELSVVLVFAAVYFCVISAGAVRFARYTLPLIPALALLTAGLMREGRPRWALPAVSAALTLTAIYCLLLNSAFWTPDPRTQAAAWIRGEIGSRSGAAVAFPTTPWFYSPPLSPGFGALTAEERRAAAEAAADIRLIVPTSDWDISVLEDRPEAVVISDFESEDPERLGTADYSAFMQSLPQDYELAREFGRQPILRAFTLARRLPHDMRYASPGISVYVRRDLL